MTEDVAEIAARLTKAQREGWNAAMQYQHERSEHRRGALWRVGALTVGMYAAGVNLVVLLVAWEGSLRNPNAWTWWAFSVVGLVASFFMWRRANKIDAAQEMAFTAKWGRPRAPDGDRQ